MSGGPELEDVHKRCLRALDLRGLNRFLANEYGDEEIRIGQDFGRTVQPVQCAVGTGE
jgi:hypothetical protein